MELQLPEQLAGSEHDDGGYDGEPERNGRVGGSEGSGNFVQNRIDALEKRIKQLEEEAKTMRRELEKKGKGTEGSKYELVNVKQMAPNI